MLHPYRPGQAPMVTDLALILALAITIPTSIGLLVLLTLLPR